MKKIKEWEELSIQEQLIFALLWSQGWGHDIKGIHHETPRSYYYASLAINTELIARELAK